MAPTREAYENALQNWARDWSGVMAIWANQNAPRPPLPFLSLNIITSVKQGQDYKGDLEVTPVPPDGEEVRRRLEGFRFLTLSVNGYGPGVLQALESLRTSLDLHEVVEAFDLAGLASIDHPPIQDLSDALDSRTEERANLTLEFSLAVEAQENLYAFGYIETVQGTGTITKDDGTEHVQDFEVPEP
jgi:hypothetical protein